MIDQKYIEAYRNRSFNSFFEENPRRYDEDSADKGLIAFNAHLGNSFSEIDQGNDFKTASEQSPFTGDKLGVTYSNQTVDANITLAKSSQLSLSKLSIEHRFAMLKESLDNLEKRFFELAYATMHTTGQSFMMSFQASGPHAADRALEAMVASYLELNTFPNKVDWIKDFGKFQLKIEKDFVPVSKGIGLVIGCSTFPTWNSVTAIYANLMCGNPVIVKPHPTSILPMAILVSEIRNATQNYNCAVDIIQIATDTLEEPITKQFTEHSEIKLIDYTGGNQFGDYVEGLEGKVTFTEKAGVNCCIIDSVYDMNKVAGNIAFSASLYSGQMCTAPQNIFIPKDGIRNGDEKLTYSETVELIKGAIVGLVENPKAGPGTLGAIQSENTLKRVSEYNSRDGVLLASKQGSNPEFENARLATPMIIETDSADYSSYSEECFGPIIFIVKTDSTESSLSLAKQLATEKGALTCLCYTTDDSKKEHIRNTMNSVFVPVSFNFTGAGFVNQHAAFSDLHVTGGNPAGNATFTNSEYISKRFVWVGNRYM
jgi:phenylacetic acid degradation protein paaN